MVFDFPDLEGDKPGYLELSAAIVAAAESGRLAAGSPLPPSRVLADSLGLSRDTVLRCYRHLKNLGWTESHGTRGTFIARVAQNVDLRPAGAVLDPGRLSQYAAGLAGDTAEHFFSLDPVVIGAVPRESLPVRRWKLAMQNAAEPLSMRDLQYSVAVLGRPELRSAVSAYFNRTKGFACCADEIAVFNISFSAMSLICRLVLDPGDAFGIEEPGYGGAREVANYLGLEIVPVPIDSEGISVEALENSPKKIKLIHVTPNHQEPTGITMSLNRRRQLVAWAQRNKALIIEDDYDGHFTYGVTMPPSLKSMDTQDNVIFLGGFWELLYPLTTLCFAAVPYSFIPVLQDAKRYTVSLSESMAQMALAEILEDGYLQKYMRKLERQFGERRRALMYELKRVFGARVQMPSHSGGITTMVQLTGYSDAAVLKAAKAVSLPVGATDSFYFEKAKRRQGEFLIWFSGVEAGEMRQKIEQWHALLNSSS